MAWEKVVMISSTGTASPRRPWVMGLGLTVRVTVRWGWG